MNRVAEVAVATPLKNRFEPESRPHADWASWQRDVDFVHAA
jgi:hypothetical protein